MHSRDVQFNVHEKDSKVLANDDEDHHLILDFSSDCEPEATTESQPPSESVPEPVLRRSTRERHQPNYYGMEQSHLSETHDEPTSFKEATACPGSSRWIQAMETEMRSLEENDV